MNYKRFLAIGLLCGAFLESAQAVDAHLSAFGTIGGAISDKEYNYQRSISDDGTLKCDSLFGAQADVAFNDQWSATFQGKLTASDDSETGITPALSWAFLSYRPTNDWLIRAGKIRMPLYLNSQNMDVGVTYDKARLPYEVYSLSPVNDGIGGIITKSFELENGELSVDIFYASANNTPYRYFMRDDMSAYSALGGLPKGASYNHLDIDTIGLTINYETDNNDRFRIGVYQAKTLQDGAKTAGNFSLQPSTTFPLSVLYPFPYYQVNGAFDKNTIIAYTVGADVGFGDEYRLMGEYAMRNMKGADTGPNQQGGYLMLSKNMGVWTPYFCAAALKSKDNVKELYNNLNSDDVNDILPINRHLADFVVAAEQRSYAIGTSYSITPLQKIKAEWMHVNVGSVSNFLIDSPGDQAITNTSLNIYTLSYSVAF